MSKKLISKGYITSDRMNSLITSFPYKYSGRVNKPKTIYKANVEKGSTGGNGQENWTLLRFPLLIGKSKNLHGRYWWTSKKLLKLFSHLFFQRKYCTTYYKLSDHRRLLTDTFPDFSLYPKQASTLLWSIGGIMDNETWDPICGGYDSVIWTLQWTARIL